MADPFGVRGVIAMIILQQKSNTQPEYEATARYALRQMGIGGPLDRSGKLSHMVLAPELRDPVSLVV